MDKEEQYLKEWVALLKVWANDRGFQSAAHWLEFMGFGDVKKMNNWLTRWRKDVYKLSAPVFKRIETERLNENAR